MRTKELCFIYITKLTLIASVSLLVLPCIPANAQNSSAGYRKTFEFKPSAATACTQKVLWFTKGPNVCAPTSTKGSYRWQVSIKKSDTVFLISTCRTFFSTVAGQMICDWIEKYVNNIVVMKGPKDNCISYWKKLLNNAALIGRANQSATLGSAIYPFMAKNSWVCHPA